MTGITAVSAILLALAGGASLAVQYTIMLAVMESGVSFASALLINSAIGLFLLSGIEISRGGPEFIINIITQAKVWFVLPGLLGTLLCSRAFTVISTKGQRRRSFSSWQHSW